MDYLGKGEMLINRDVNKCTTFERDKLFVGLNIFGDLLFQLMKHGTNTLHVAFIFLFSENMHVFERRSGTF